MRIAVVRHLAVREPTDAESILPTIQNDFWRQSVRIELVDSLPVEAFDRKIAPARGGRARGEPEQTDEGYRASTT